MTLIEYLSTDVQNHRAYFCYSGEETHVRIFLKWRNLTAYKTEMHLSKNPDIIYFIESIDFFNSVEDYHLEFVFPERTESIPITLISNSGNFQGVPFRTLKDDVSFWTYKEIFIDKIYISDIVKVEKNDLVVDIGTNYGFFSVQAGEAGARDIICYEPSRMLQECLRSNLSSKIFHINQAGVSGTSRIAKFSDSLISSAGNHISEEGYEVNIVDINSLIDYIEDQIDFLKIDCEGEEIEIFESIQSRCLSRVKKLVVEYHQESTEELIVNKLKIEGFEIEKIQNMIVYAFNPKLFKKVALISTFCDTEEKKNVLRETVQKIKNFGIDIMAIGPREIHIPDDIVELCDFFFYTKENPLLKWPQRAYTHWYEKQNDYGVTTMHRGLADYGWAALYQTKKLSQIALTFDYDIFYHLIYDLEIDEVIEKELLRFEKNIIHPRRDPHHPETLWEATLHFMIFDRDMMEKIENDITLGEYLRTNGVAEGEVLKWKNKFGIRTSDHPVKDRIFYWEDYDFFNYSPFSEFKLFFSKNEETEVWLGYENAYSHNLSDALKIVFYEFEKLNEIKVLLNEEEFIIEPEAWKIEEFPISSQDDIYRFVITYEENSVDLTDVYNKQMRNLIYYNHR